ncbi:hypothetical protein BJ742DRAFT_780919 [Cladochytrium replicatum]|nr:hypothetical protein BJ742DRAFT_780919 [Cladochytrium replicatum]
MSAIIYEVNLSVAKEKSEEYTEWLRTFTKSVVDDVDGFTACDLFSQPKPPGLHWLSEEGVEKAYFTVHYHVQSPEHLEAYLKNHQPRVAHAQEERFGFLVTSRRILRAL